MTQCNVRKAMETGIMNLKAHGLAVAAMRAETSLMKHETSCKYCQGLAKAVQRPTTPPRDRMREALDEAYKTTSKRPEYAGGMLKPQYMEEEGREVVVYHDISEERTGNRVKNLDTETGKWLNNTKAQDTQITAEKMAVEAVGRFIRSLGARPLTQRKRTQTTQEMWQETEAIEKELKK